MRLASLLPALAVVALALPAAPAAAVTVSQSAKGTVRVVTIDGDSALNDIEVQLEDPGGPGGDVLVYGGDGIAVAPLSSGCAVEVPGKVRCSAESLAAQVRVAFTGYEGDDRLLIEPGTAVRFDGGPGDDRLQTYAGQALPVIATGDAGDDELAGGAGTDVLDGGPGADRLQGRAAGDRLRGGPGDDVLVGGTGRDVLDCGGGRGDVGRADRTDRAVRGCERVTGRPRRR